MTFIDADQPVQLSYAADTDVGRSRQGKPNQDSIGTFEPDYTDAALLAAKGKLFVVADGMGGAAGGEEASSMAVDLVFQRYYADPDSDIVASLERAIEAANTEIQQHGRANPELRGLGTTIVLAVIRGRTLVMGNVGDSRGYLFRQAQLLQLSLDHTTVQEQVREGLLTPEEALIHPRRHVLSRNLGYRPRAEPEFATQTLEAGDTLLLCSDGLWGSVEDPDLAAVLQRTSGAEAVDALIDSANDQGGPDNISAIVIHIDGIGAAVQAATTEPHGPANPPAAPGWAAAVTEQVSKPPAMPPPATLQTSRVVGAPQAVAAPRNRYLLWSLAALGVSVLLLAGAFVWPGFLSGSGQTLNGNLQVVGAGESPTAGGLNQTSAGSLPSSAAVAMVVPSATPTTGVTPSATAMPTIKPSITPTTAPTVTPTVAPAPTAAPIATPFRTLVLRQDPFVGVQSLALSSNGQLLAAGSREGTISLWQMPGNNLIQTFQGSGLPISSLTFSPDGNWLASAAQDEGVKLWPIQVAPTSLPVEQPLPEPSTDQLQLTETDPNLRVYGATFTTGKLRFATEQNGNIVLWEQGDQSATWTTQEPGSRARNVVFAADGQTFAILDQDQTVQVLRMNSSSVDRTIPNRDKRIASLTFSPDGRTLLVAQAEGIIECWSVGNGDRANNDTTTTAEEPTTCAEGPSSPIPTATATPLATVEPTSSPTPPLDAVETENRVSLVFSPSGQELVAVNQTGTIRTWPVPISNPGVPNEGPPPDAASPVPPAETAPPADATATVDTAPTTLTPNTESQ